MDYFTKWAEVEALANIGDVDVKKFCVEEEVCMEEHNNEI